MSRRQSCWLAFSKKKGSSTERFNFIQKMKFSEICTKNMLGCNKTENKLLEIMDKSLDIK